MRHVNDRIPPVRAIDPSIDAGVSPTDPGAADKDPAARTGSAAAAWDAYHTIADRLLPRRWHRVARLTGKPDEAPPAAAPPPFTPPPPDLPPWRLRGVPGADARAAPQRPRGTAGGGRAERGSPVAPPPTRTASRPDLPRLSLRRDRTPSAVGGIRRARRPRGGGRRGGGAAGAAGTTLGSSGDRGNLDREPGRRRRGGRRHPRRAERAGPLRTGWASAVGTVGVKPESDADRARPRHTTQGGRNSGRGAGRGAAGVVLRVRTRSRSSTRRRLSRQRRSRRRPHRGRSPSEATRSSCPNPTARRAGCSATTPRRAPRRRAATWRTACSGSCSAATSCGCCDGPHPRRYDATIGTQLSRRRSATAPSRWWSPTASGHGLEGRLAHRV